MRATTKMKLVGEEILSKAGEMYVNISIWYRDVAAKISMLENQNSLVETDYKACI